MRLIDIAGKKFNCLTAVKLSHINNNGVHYWLFKCDCGKEIVASKSAVTSGHTKSCGCLGSEEDITGRTFNKLTAIKFHHRDKDHKNYWVFRCSCGKEIITRKTAVTSGTIKSCGCIRKVPNRTHGLSNDALYSIFQSMKQRCYNKKDRGYTNYGGRGIGVCESWLNKPESFYDWALTHGYKKGLSIDRIDNNKGYCPENCRWTTMKTQQRNKRTTRLLTYKGETQCLKDWADYYKISGSTLRGRLKRGWSLNDALTLIGRRKCA